MKVRLTVTVDVDPEAWANEYGLTPEEVRADVKDYIEVHVNGSNAHIVGLLKNTVVR